jgi:hypothetical protein
MVKTNRYNGLLYLKAKGLPVPEFQKISNFSDINEDLAQQLAPFGWTIRTCKKNGFQEFNLFYKNNTPYEKIKEILFERLSTYNDEFYIIYHSWDFDYSFNVVKDGNEYIIEGDLGSQKEISQGSSSPKFSIIINSYNLTIKNSYLGSPSDKIKKGIYRALRFLEDNIDKNKYYTEVALTKQKQLYFYEFTDISLY